MSPAHLLALFGLSPLLASPAVAGDELLTVLGNPDEAFGVSLSRVGDMDGDGQADLVVGAVRVLDSEPPPRVRVHSTKDGAVLFEQVSDGLLDGYGLDVADAGDLNGDGTGDFWVGAPGVLFGVLFTGRVEARSGADGSVLVEHVAPAAQTEFGRQVVSPGDLDGDGVPDVVISASRENDEGVVRAFSGADGSLMWASSGAVLDWFGWALDAIGDADLDGVVDVVGTSNGGNPFVPASPYAAVLSGADGTRLVEVGQPLAGRFGEAVAGVGDWNGDGRPEFAVGSGLETGAPFPFIDVYSSVDGALVRRISAAGPDTFGLDVEGLGDVNGDGVDDLGTWVVQPDGQSFARVHSGRTGGAVDEVELPTDSADGTFALARMGDLDADGVDDWALSASGSEGPSEVYDPGVVRVVAGEGPPLQRSPASLSVSAGGAISFVLDAGGFHANDAYLLLGSISGTSPGQTIGTFPVPLNFDDYFGNTLAAPNSLPLGSSLGTLGVQGKSNASFLLLPSQATGLVGLTVSHAFVILSDPLTFASNPVDFVLAP